MVAVVQEYLTLLNGTLEQKRFLYETILSKVAANEPIEDSERVMLEYLKQFFVQGE